METADSPLQTNLTHQTLRGIFWSYLSFVGGKGLAFISTIILARLLSPEQFGLMGYCLIAIQYLDILNKAGFDNALIARKDDIEEAANAALVSSFVLGVVWFGIAWFTAPFVAAFFKSPEVTVTLRVLALMMPLAGIGQVPDALIQRGLRFKTRLIPDLSRNLAKGLVSIGMALTGFGVWSLVGGMIASEAARSLLSWRLVNWKPTWRFKKYVTRAVWVFGAHIILVDLTGAVANNVDYLLIGRILGAGALGYYTMAFRMPELIIRSLNYVIGRVSFPVLAQTQSDPGKLRTFYFGYIRYLALFVYPVGFGLALISPIFIPLFLSDKWLPAVVPTALISVALAIMAIGYVPGVLYKAIGRPDILNKMSIIQVPTAVLVLWYSTRWGINGVAAGQIVIAFVNVALHTLTVNKVMHYSFSDLTRALLPGLSSASVMALVVWGVWKVFRLEGFFGLSIMLLIGAAVYFLMLLLVSRETVLRGYQVLMELISRDRIRSVETVHNE
jgi:O-antigen/teichoic acid export membrane protein